MAFARGLLASDESAAAYQMDVSTKRLMSAPSYRRRERWGADKKASASIAPLLFAMSEPIAT